MNTTASPQSRPLQAPIVCSGLIRNPGASVDRSSTISLLTPAFLILAWLIARFSCDGSVSTAILLAGGSLVAGFVQSMPEPWSAHRDTGHTLIGTTMGIACRSAIGLFAISAMICAAMWATGTL